MARCLLKQKHGRLCGEYQKTSGATRKARRRCCTQLLGIVLDKLLDQAIAEATPPATPTRQDAQAKTERDAEAVQYERQAIHATFSEEGFVAMSKYSYSTDEERYHGQYESIDEAVIEAFNDYGLDEGDQIHIGANVAPPPPEDSFFANDWLEQVSCQDEYSGEWAEDWCGETKEQREELEAAVRKVMADWLDRHKLRPQFWNIEYVGRFTIEGGKVVKR